MNRVPESAFSTKTTYPGQLLDLEDSFRVVEIQPGKHYDFILVRLLNTRLRESPVYEALSYTWGDGALTEQIQLSDSTGASSDSMLVTANCYSALKRLRKADSPRTIWIDSLCINQDLVLERNHQLGLMSQIYGRASRVVVYLGESADESDKAMDWIREIDVPSDFGQFASSDPYYGRVKIIRPDTTMIEALLRRPWFSRVWVLQEVALANKAVVCCGNKEISWESFKAFKYWNVAASWVETLPYAVETTVKSLYSGGGTPGRRLLSMLAATRHCGATDPRDKLFAILPLLDLETKYFAQQSAENQRLGELRDALEERKQAQGEEAKQMEKDLDRKIVDYGHTPAQVFADLAIYLLETLGLDVLCQVVGPSNMPRLPSWVPDWSIASNYTHKQADFGDSLRERSYAGLKLKSPKRWHEGPANNLEHRWRISKPTYHESLCLYQLETPAVKVGVIELLGDKCEVDKNYFPLAQWQSLVTDPKLLDLKGRLSAFQLLLVLDVVVYPGALTRGYRRIEEYNKGYYSDEEWRIKFDPGYEGGEKADSRPKMPLRDIMKGMAPSDSRQAKILFQSCDGRRFIVTDLGHIGLAPEDAKVGDSVFVLEGASVPFVFRDRRGAEKEENQTVKLVGECYVQGFMTGEAWQDKSKVEELVIF